MKERKKERERKGINQSVKQTHKQKINKISFPKFVQDSSLLGCSTVLTGKQLPALRWSCTVFP